MIFWWRAYLLHDIRLLQNHDAPKHQDDGNNDTDPDATAFPPWGRLSPGLLVSAVGCTVGILMSFSCGLGVVNVKGGGS